MKFRGIILISASILLAIIALVLFVAKRRSISRYPTTEHDRQIALACLKTLRSVSDGEELEPDDPRLPQILKNLHPVGITVNPDSFIIFPSGTENPREYHLSRSPKDSEMWILYIVPPAPANVEHLEALTIRGDEIETSPRK